MVATALLSLFMDMQSAIILTIVPTIIINIFTIISIKKFLYLIKEYFLLAFFALVRSTIGTLILIRFETDIYKLLLAFMIFFYLFLDAYRIDFDLNKFSKFGTTLFFGFSAGFIGGLTNVIASILIIYTLGMKMEKDNTIVALNLSFLFGKLSQLLIFSFEENNHLILSPYVLFAYIISLLTGIFINKKIPVRVYKSIMKKVLAIIAIMLIIQLILGKSGLNIYF